MSLSSSMRLSSLLAALTCTSFFGWIPSVAAQSQMPSTVQETLPPRRSSPLLQGISLTPEQQTAAQQIRRETRSQLTNLLTPEQKMQMNQLRQQTSPKTGGLQAVIEQLNPTPEQLASLRSILEGSRQQLRALLTAEQQSIFDSNWQAMQAKIGEKAFPEGIPASATFPQAPPP
ncbi:MAG: hypothetical protein NW237_13855 [Cyanobacteriota bacterium]|nr:hypothetical protein [Cyanobacteriota bacterium]